MNRNWPDILHHDALIILTTMTITITMTRRTIKVAVRITTR
jgi:hypothetical protein